MDKQLFGTISQPTITAGIPSWSSIPLIGSSTMRYADGHWLGYWLCLYCGAQWHQTKRPQTCYGHCGGSEFVHIAGDDVYKGILRLNSGPTPDLIERWEETLHKHTHDPPEWQTFSGVYNGLADAATESTRKWWWPAWKLVDYVLLAIVVVTLLIYWLYRVAI